jgi:hypothetical protein
MRTFSLVMALAAALAGCGPDVAEREEGRGPPGGGGGWGGWGGSKASGGAGGSGASSASGGASGTPEVARGAVEIRLSPPNTSIPNVGTRTACTAGTTGTYTYFLGASPQGATGEARVRSGLLESGQDLTVDCSVVARAAGGYAVAATMSGVDANSRRVAVLFTLEGVVTADAAPSDNVGTVEVYTPDTTSLSPLPDLPTCVLGPVYVAKAGALLADFNCPLLGDESDTVKGCQATGTIAIERCLTED